MWLRDYLPRDIKNARILIYGYPSALQENVSRNILSDHSINFMNRLMMMRESAKVGIFIDWMSIMGLIINSSIAVPRSTYRLYWA